MPVPHQRRGLIHELVAGEEHPDEHVDVLAPSGLRSDAQRLVEATEGGDCPAAHGEVGPRPERADLEGKQVLVARRCREAVDAWGAPARPRDASVEVGLRKAAQLGTGDHATDAGDVRAGGKTVDQSPQPPAVDDDVVVDRKSTRLNSSHEWISYAVFC